MTLAVKIEERRRRIVRVGCPICDRTLQDLVVVGGENNEWVERVNGKDYIVRHVMLAPTDAYREAKIEFDDGSMHVTPICDRCINAATEAQMQEIFDSEVKRWKSCGMSQAATSRLSAKRVRKIKKRGRKNEQVA